MSRISVSIRTLLAGTLLLAASARAESPLRPVDTLPELQRTIIADNTARAFDRLRAARSLLDARHPYEARLELAQARSLLGAALGASPATTVLDDITTLFTRLHDPTELIGVGAVDPIFEAIAAAGDAEAYAATIRWVERARYQLWAGSAEGAATQLVAAAARVPYSEIDGPLAAVFADVSVAMIELRAVRLTEAAAILAEAEQSTHAVVRLASGEATALPEAEAVRAPTDAREPPTSDSMIEKPLASDSKIEGPPASDSMGEGATEVR